MTYGEVQVKGNINDGGVTCNVHSSPPPSTRSPSSEELNLSPVKYISIAVEMSPPASSRY